MIVYIAIGSNQGDAAANCRQAIQIIAADGRNCLLKGSPFYRTEPVGVKDQEWFVNGAIAVESSMGAKELLDFLLAIEKRMGRVRTIRWGPRLIDLDILFYGDKIIQEEGLTIPHPLLHERKFVLLPLQDIAPHFKHPILEKTVSQLLGELQGNGIVLPLEGGNFEPCGV